jgi:DNA-binding MarR family transcriptional regulator
MEATSDWTAKIVDRWREIRPDLDTEPMLVIARLQRLAALVDDLLRPPFAEAGLANGDFDLLAALRRQGPPHEARPGDLATAMLVTTGATTKRIDRLERQGHVTRRVSDVDGRGRVVALTPSGRRLVDRMFAAHLENEASMLAPLGERRSRQLASLLGELALSVEAMSVEATTRARPVRK